MSIKYAGIISLLSHKVIYEGTRIGEIRSHFYLLVGTVSCPGNGVFKQIVACLSASLASLQKEGSPPTQPGGEEGPSAVGDPSPARPSPPAAEEGAGGMELAFRQRGVNGCARLHTPLTCQPCHLSDSRFEFFSRARNKSFSLFSTDTSALSVGFISASTFLKAWMVRNLESTTEVQIKENKKMGDGARNFL